MFLFWLKYLKAITVLLNKAIISNSWMTIFSINCAFILSRCNLSKHDHKKCFEGQNIYFFLSEIFLIDHNWMVGGFMWNYQNILLFMGVTKHTCCNIWMLVRYIWQSEHIVRIWTILLTTFWCSFGSARNNNYKLYFLFI